MKKRRVPRFRNQVFIVLPTILIWNTLLADQAEIKTELGSASQLLALEYRHEIEGGSRFEEFHLGFQRFSQTQQPAQPAIRSNEFSLSTRWDSDDFLIQPGAKLGRDPSNDQLWYGPTISFGYEINLGKEETSAPDQSLIPSMDLEVMFYKKNTSRATGGTQYETRSLSFALEYLQSEKFSLRSSISFHSSSIGTPRLIKNRLADSRSIDATEKFWISRDDQINLIQAFTWDDRDSNKTSWRLDVEEQHHFSNDIIMILGLGRQSSNDPTLPTEWIALLGVGMDF